jgi:hypothetical protein
MGLQRGGRITKMSVGALLASGAVACVLSAQSDSDRAAWNAMMLSPVGALAPLARDPIDDDVRQANVWIRYGRWRYDVDDAIHNNIGVTVFRAIPFPLPSTELSLTGAYVSLSCSLCPPWISGGASLSSMLWQQGEVDDRWTSLGVRADIGGAHYRGSSETDAGSFAAAVVAGLGVPLVLNWHLSATMSPGVGLGRIALADGVHSGTRRTLGGALALIHASGFALNVGLQKIMIAGGPIEIGAGLGWSR